ncbi:unannotated protein [freshwater metagenome]|uniref:Unannotated protein n=1 Tax=freshwater metagenome TaxID=449393 RepID=A0A6J7L3H3_9ZZZZ
MRMTSDWMPNVRHDTRVRPAVAGSGAVRLARTLRPQESRARHWTLHRKTQRSTRVRHAYHG